jgi:hypothetical protein
MVDSNLESVPRMAMSIPSAAKAAGLSRAMLYVAISAPPGTGKLRTLKVGSRRLVRPEDLHIWLENHQAA